MKNEAKARFNINTLLEAKSEDLNSLMGKEQGIVEGNREFIC